MIVKVVVPDSIYAQVYFARGEQGPIGATGATGVQGPTGATGAAGTNGTDGVGYTGVTSATNIAIGAGLKTFTVANVGAFIPGMRIRAVHNSTPATFVEGPCNVATGTTIIITVDKFNGSGSHDGWVFASAGEIGATGSTGATGATGSSGVIAVTAPITNTGTSTSANIGIDQTGLTLAQSQITNLVTDLANTAKKNAANAFTVGGHTITPEAVGVIPLTIRNIASQTANPFRIRNSADTGDIFQVDTSGNVRAIAFLNPNSFNNSRIRVNDTGTIIDTGILTNKALVVQNTNATATANLQEWQNSGGTAIASITNLGAASFASGNATISSGGRIAGIQVSTINDLGTMREQNGGGFIRMTKGTAVAVNPGANLASLYFRDGTTAGTLKLVVRAGASGAETTILDNIPQ